MQIVPFDLELPTSAAQRALEDAQDFLQGVGDAVADVVSDVVADGQRLLADAAEFAAGVGDAAWGAAQTVGAFALRTGEITVQQVVDFATMWPELGELRDRCMAANAGPAGPSRYDDPEHAQDFLDLSLAIYGDSPVPEGYVEVTDAEERLGVPLRDEETGLEARVYYNEEEDLYVLVFEGTTSDDEGADWGANLANGAGGIPEQYRQALDIALRFGEVYGAEGDTVVTGHSLGGGLATFAGVGAGLETYTYNPSGLGPGSKLFLDSMGLVARNQDNVHNFVQRGEILDGLRMAQVGLMVATSPFGVGGLLAPWLGSLVLVGETEHVGSYGRDPITAHNDPDLSTLG